MHTLTAVKARVPSQAVDYLLSRLQPQPVQDSAIRRTDMIGTDVAFARNALFYEEGEASTYLYRIVTGLARSFRMTGEDRRQITAFYVPGDLFGFEAGDTHTLSAEAVTNMRVRMIKRTSIADIAARNDEVARQLWVSVSREICRDQEHILQFGRPAEERIASFLLDMARRIPNVDSEVLLISRQDMADYLDLRIETVSRIMTRLAKSGVITLSGNRKITIRNLAALDRMMN